MPVSRFVFTLLNTAVAWHCVDQMMGDVRPLGSQRASLLLDA